MKDMKTYAVSLLAVVANEAKYWGKRGVFPSQQRILNELEKKFGLNRCIRTYNRWAAELESRGLIRRKKRHKKDPLLGWIFRSSLTTITRSGWVSLINAGHYTWKEFNNLIKEAEASFRKPKKTRKVFRSSGSLTSVGDILGGLGYDTS